MISVGLAVASAAIAAAPASPPAARPVKVDLRHEAAKQFDILCAQFVWQRSPWKPGGDGGVGAKRFTFNGQIVNQRPDCTWFDKLAPETVRRDALILPEDRDPVDVALRRTEALLRDSRRRETSRPASSPRRDRFPRISTSPAMRRGFPVRRRRASRLNCRWASGRVADVPGLPRAAARGAVGAEGVAGGAAARAVAAEAGSGGELAAEFPSTCAAGPLAQSDCCGQG
jgi:hypothetical protein